MQITVNTTPYEAEVFAASDKHAQRKCIVVLKATYSVSAQGECQVAEEQAPFVYTDEHHGDPESSSVLYEGDFVPVKPFVDILVNASAIAPNGHAVRAMEVSLEGPQLSKKAIVTGDRVWEVGGLWVKRASKPIPFLSMPLVWERAFGGSDNSNEKVSKNGSELRNLVGIGFHLNGQTVGAMPIPNIEKPSDRMSSWEDKIEPVGFNSVGRGWRPRIQFAGTYDQQWLDQRMPFLPEDFDDRYFQSAPMDQQIGKLAPGAMFRCINMNEDNVFLLQAPSLRTPVRFIFDNKCASKWLEADTLIMEPQNRRAIMVGRVSVDLPRKFTSLREIHVGPQERTASNKPHYKDLNEAMTTMRAK